VAKITVNNWFTTTDISVYQATKSNQGVWEKRGGERNEKDKGTLWIDIKWNHSAEFEVQYQGVWIDYWPTVSIEKSIGHCEVVSPYTLLDVFDIAAGYMPHGYYASWRAAWLT